MTWWATSARLYLDDLRKSGLREIPPQRGRLVGGARVRAVLHIRRGVAAQVEFESKV